MSYKGLLRKTVFITLALVSAVFLSSCGGGGSDGDGGGTGSNALTLTINSSLGSATSAKSIPITLIFNKLVTDFTEYDIEVTNGTITSFSWVSAYDYRATIEPDEDQDPADITVYVAEGAAVTPDGERSPEAWCHISYGSLVLNIDSPLSDITPADVIPVTFTFNYEVDDFDENDISVTNGEVISFSGSGAEYTVEIEPVSDGIVEVSVEAGAATDTYGTGCTSGSFSITYEAFSLVISSTQSSPTAVDPIPVTFTFNRNVVDFDENDVSVTNGMLRNFSGSGAVYTVEITPVTSGRIEITVEEGAATDEDGIECGPVSFSITFDPETLSVNIESSLSSPTVAPVIPVTFTFNRDVEDFSETDVSVTNGTLSNFSGSDAIYTTEIIPEAEGTVEVLVEEGAATDMYGIGCSSGSFSITFNPGELSVVIESSLSSPANTDAIPVTFTFNRNVVDFDESDVSVTNGTLDDFSGSGAVYTAEIRPEAEGIVEILVEEGSVTDIYGVKCSSGSFSITFDPEELGLLIRSSLSSPTPAHTIPVTFTFERYVSDFVESDVSVTNGALSNFSGSGAVYTAEITPTTDGVVRVAIAAGAATDIYGIESSSASFNIIFEEFSLVIESSLTNPTTNSTIPLTFSFNYDVTGFEAGDVSVTNGTLDGFSGSGAVYTAEITADEPEEVTVEVAAGAAQDNYGNVSPSALFTIVYKISWLSYLKAPNNSNGDNFGYSVAISGDTIVVGASLEDSNTTEIINGSDLSGTNDDGSGNGAVYVFTRSGTIWSHQAYLKAPNSSDDDYFRTVAIDGDTIAVGAFGEGSTTTAIINGSDLSSTDDDGDSNGAVYVFTRSGTEWSHQAYLKAPNHSDYDHFGTSVAIDGDTIAVGASWEDSDTTAIINGSDLSATNNYGSSNGAVYVYTRSGVTWSHQAYLKAPNSTPMDYFGGSVAISGDTIAVGAYNEKSTTTKIINGSDLSATNLLGFFIGAVYVFTRSGSTWSHQAYLKAPNCFNSENFGYSVGIDGDTIVVGAYHEDSTTTAIINGSDLSSTDDDGDSNGAVYVFTRSGTEWSHQAYLKAPNNSDYDFFGRSVAISGDMIAVGASDEGSNTKDSIFGSDLSAANDDGILNGAVYVFTRSGTTWSHHAYLKAPNSSNSDFFGYSVAIDGETIAVGAYREGSTTTGIINGTDLSATNNSGSNNGAVYVFTLDSE